MTRRFFLRCGFVLAAVIGSSQPTLVGAAEAVEYTQTSASVAAEPSMWESFVRFFRWLS